MLAWWSNSVKQRKHVRVSSCNWECACAEKSQPDSAEGSFYASFPASYSVHVHDVHTIEYQGPAVVLQIL